MSWVYEIDANTSSGGGSGTVSSVTNTDGSLTSSPTTGAVVIALNVANTNTWTALQTFGNNLSFGGIQVNISSPTSGQVLEYNGTNWVNTNLSSAVSSVSNSDGTLTISPTTGIVVASINLGNANTWSAVQTFSTATKHSMTQTTLSGTSAGSIIWSQPEQGTAWKKFIAYFSGYENTTGTAQTIAYSTAFTNTPIVTGNSTGTTPTISNTTVTLPINMGATATGFLIVEGY
jgi:hypothetical protein